MESFWLPCQHLCGKLWLSPSPWPCNLEVATVEWLVTAASVCHHQESFRLKLKARWVCGRLNRLLVTANPLPLSVLSEVRVVKMDIQADFGWGWKQLVGGGCCSSQRKGVCAEGDGFLGRREQLWAEEGPCQVTPRAPKATNNGSVC